MMNFGFALTVVLLIGTSQTTAGSSNGSAERAWLYGEHLVPATHTFQYRTTSTRTTLNKLENPERHLRELVDED
jgi:hypothetical protein